MNNEIIIKLDANQRFLIEDPESLCVMIVDEIIIHPVANQINYSGYLFDIDYDEMSFCRKRKSRMIYHTSFDCSYDYEER